MGLDITAYRNLKIIENPQIDDEGELVNWETEWKPGGSMEWSEKNFPGRGEGIDAQKVYTWEETFGFRAGSYGGYNFWRKKLENIAEGEDFQELINFADNEGVIGFVVARKLAKDFNENIEKAKLFSKSQEDGEYWFKLYLNWKTAFELASNGGAVEFH